MISHCDSAFAVWNILTSPKLSSGEESDQHCFMVQGNDSLEVNSDTQLDDSSSSCDENMDADALNEELSIVCEKLLEKYQVLKKRIRIYFQNLIWLCKRGLRFHERDSLKTQLDLVLKENEILKNKNDCDDALKKNKILSSKLEIVLKENNSLKNKIALI